MTVYRLEIGRVGQIEDVAYFCANDCMGRKVWAVAGVRDDSRFLEGHKITPDNREYIWGSSHGSNETDYDVWCAGCGDFLWHGMNCECEDPEAARAPLTTRQLRHIL